MAKLTTTQLDFIKHLFGKANGDMKKASFLAIENEDYSGLLTDELLDEIKRRADQELILNVPKAIFIMNKMLSEPESMPFLEKLHKVSADILDRAGLSKRERPSSSNMTVGVILLPNKAKLPELPDDTAITIDNPLKALKYDGV